MAKVRRTTIPMPSGMRVPSKPSKTSKATAKPPSRLPVVGKAPKS